MFRLLPRITTSRPLLIVFLMAVLSAVALSQGAGLAERLSGEGFTNDGAESSKALDQIAEATGADMRSQVIALIDAGRPIDSRRGRSLVRKVTRAFDKEPDMKIVNGPFDDGETDRSLISKDGRSAIVVGNLKDDNPKSDAPDRLFDKFAGDEQVTLGGWELTQRAVNETIASDLRRAELLAFPLILLIALFVFRGLIAALLPLLVGAITIPVTFALIRVFNDLSELSVFALNLTTGMGLGLAIDYSLLMVTRFREELAAGSETQEAVRRTINTAGRTVAYSAITVAGATAALMVFPLKFLFSMGVGGATVALVSAVVALTLLPAMLMLLGKRIDRFGIPRRSAEHSIAAWHGLASRVMARPVPVIAITTALLVALALPVAGIRFTSVDATVLKRGADARVVQEAVDNDFPRNDANSTLWAVVASDRYDAVKVNRDAKKLRRDARRVERDSNALKRDARDLRVAMLTPGADPAELKREQSRIDRESKRVKRAASRIDDRKKRLDRAADRLDRFERRLKRYAKNIRTVDGVDATGKLEVAGKHTWRFDIYTGAKRYAQPTQQAVRDVRSLEAPGERWVGGTSASFVDQRDTIMDHVGLALALIGGITFIALFLMTGSIVLPLKTFIMNLLTLGATFGILVAIFQENRLESLLGYEGQSALEMTQPVLLFAIAFGLATDYGVFLLSRIKELHDGGQTNSEAVANGVARTGRVISSAALLFCVSILSFSTSEIVFVKELGIGTALAVAIDATIVRAMLVPALMAVLGKYNWWSPRPLRLLHAKIGLSEGPGVGEPIAASAGVGTAAISPVNLVLPAPAGNGLTDTNGAGRGNGNSNGHGNGAGNGSRRHSVPPPVHLPVPALSPVIQDSREAVAEATAAHETPTVPSVQAETAPAVSDDRGVEPVAGIDPPHGAVGDARPSGLADLVGDQPQIDDGKKRVYNLRIELSTSVSNHLGASARHADRAPVGAVGDHRVERVADQHDAAGKRNFVANKAVWVAAAVPALVFVANRLRHR